MFVPPSRETPEQVLILCSDQVTGAAVEDLLHHGTATSTTLAMALERHASPFLNFDRTTSNIGLQVRNFLLLPPL